MILHNFDSSIVMGAAARCERGHPSVLLCKSIKNGAPFPTNFWLSCPKLVQRAGEAESKGGVGELEKFIEANAFQEWVEYNQKHARIRIALASDEEIEKLPERAREKLCDPDIGIGGIRFDGSVHVKCLHLQLASWLALGHHPGAAWLNLHLTKSTMSVS